MPARIRPDEEAPPVTAVVRGEGVRIAGVYPNEESVPPGEPVGTIFLIVEE